MIPKTIPNPEWTPGEDDKLQRQLTIDDMICRGECPEDAFPEEYDKALPDEGGWIMLLMSVRVGKVLADGQTTKIINVPHFSIWYATPYVSNCRVRLHDIIVKPRGKRKGDSGYAYLRQAVIQTPDGAVHIWPHEYRLVSIEKFLEFTEEDGFSIHFLSPSTAGFPEEALFYLRSRGIGKAHAERMLMPVLKDPLYCYFTFAPEIAKNFGEGVGTPYLNSVNHQRRARGLVLLQNDER